MDQPAATTEAAFVYVTVPDEATAGKLAEAAVSSRLAACANILPGMRSVYWWKGGVDRADEIVMIFKTRADLVNRLSEILVASHPYECPCVVALPIVGGNPDFLKWIAAETAMG